MTFPLLTDFAVRLAFGLAACLSLTSWRAVPLAFFRTHCLVILGVLVLAALDASRVGVRGPFVPGIVVAAALGYFASIAWGLGLPSLGVGLTATVAGVTGWVLVVASRAGDPGLWALNAAGRLASAVLMGATLTAMLLGHHYLTAPAMSIEPLKRFVRAMAAALGLRAALAAVGLALWLTGSEALTGSNGAVSPLFLAIRWGMGVVGPALATYLTWKTVAIRSTQSATGILYIAMILVLFGELTAMILSRDARLVF